MYSVGEIDEMRWLVGEILYYDQLRMKDVEEQLRTYMYNGTTVRELREHLVNMKNRPPYWKVARKTLC